MLYCYNINSITKRRFGIFPTVMRATWGRCRFPGKIVPFPRKLAGFIASGVWFIKPGPRKFSEGNENECIPISILSKPKYDLLAKINIPEATLLFTNEKIKLSFQLEYNENMLMNLFLKITKISYHRTVAVKFH